MKFLLSLLAFVAFSVVSVQAQCKDCGCKEKCTPKCRCKHEEKSKTQ